MQRAVLQQATFTGAQSRDRQIVADHVSGLEDEAVNDDAYEGEESPFRMMLLVLANVIGGSLLLSGMFFLPHLIARILS